MSVRRLSVVNSYRTLCCAGLWWRLLMVFGDAEDSKGEALSSRPPTAGALERDRDVDDCDSDRLLLPAPSTVVHVRFSFKGKNQGTPFPARSRKSGASWRSLNVEFQLASNQFVSVRIPDKTIKKAPQSQRLRGFYHQPIP